MSFGNQRSTFVPPYIGEIEPGMTAVVAFREAANRVLAAIENLGV